MGLQTDHLERTLLALESALQHYGRATRAGDATEQEVFRMAIVKGFELTQEVSYKLLKRQLRAFGWGAQKIEATPVKELLRRAASVGLLTLDEVERWFRYRSNRNDTAHDFGKRFARETLVLLPGFIDDVRVLLQRLQQPSSEPEE